MPAFSLPQPTPAFAPLPVRFEPWKFRNAEEETASQIFSTDQKRNLENEMIRVMGEKALASIRDAGTMESYLYAQEYMRGQIELLQWLLATSESQLQRQQLQPRQSV